MSFGLADKIENKIFQIRGKKVMLDKDLATLYKVETKVLLQSVKRNSKRFPGDFMFQLTKGEFDSLRSQIVTSKNISLKLSHISTWKFRYQVLIRWYLNYVHTINVLKNENIVFDNYWIWIFHDLKYSAYVYTWFSASLSSTYLTILSNKLSFI